MKSYYETLYTFVHEPKTDHKTDYHAHLTIILSSNIVTMVTWQNFPPKKYLFPLLFENYVKKYLKHFEPHKPDNVLHNLSSQSKNSPHGQAGNTLVSVVIHNQSESPQIRGFVFMAVTLPTLSHSMSSSVWQISDGRSNWNGLRSLWGHLSRFSAKIAQWRWCLYLTWVGKTQRNISTNSTINQQYW